MNYEDAYGRMHEKAKVFPGYSIKPYVAQIAALVDEVGPERMLDYGCGKGFQYLNLRVHERWGGLLPHCYDPGVPQLRDKPVGVFQGVICTDVMEHVEEADVDDVLKDIFSFASFAERSFVFFCICCRPAKRKRLPDGRNVHVTVKPPEWWDKKLARFQRDGLIIAAEYDEAEL